MHMHICGCKCIHTCIHSTHCPPPLSLTHTHTHTHTHTVDYSKPIDLTDLSNKVRMGNNAATVLKTELPMMKATPVSYLMYGPFGSFAPAYDSAFASLSKTDSELLLSTYGNELGVSYAHSLQQFVKGTGSFVTEMADAVLNGLTNNRHSKFIEKMKQASNKNSSASEDKESKASPKETKPKPESAEKVSEAISTDVTEAPSPGSEEAMKDGPPVADGDDRKTTLQGTELTADSATSFPIVEDTQTPPEGSITEDSSTFPMDTDSRPSFSVDDMVTETSSPFPQDEESRSSFPDSRFESRATSPLSMANSDSGVPSMQGGESSSSSRENPDESEVDGSSEGGSSRSSSVSERDDQDEDSRDSHVSGRVIIM